jgi:anaerobic C4-dicarboxylate transporter
MVRRLVVAVAVFMAVVMATALVPRRAEAVDDLVYIIPAAISGVVIIVLVVAVLMANRDDDQELSLTAEEQQLPRQARDGFRLAPNCKPSGGGLALFCW